MIPRSVNERSNLVRTKVTPVWHVLPLVLFIHSTLVMTPPIQKALAVLLGSYFGDVVSSIDVIIGLMDLGDNYCAYGSMNEANMQEVLGLYGTLGRGTRLKVVAEL